MGMFDDTFAQEPNTDAELQPAPVLDDANSTPEPEAPPQYLSRDEFEQWKQEYDAQANARLQDAVRQAQSIASKARNAAIQKSQAFETEYAPLLKQQGITLSPEQIAETKRAIIDREFWQPDAQPPAPTPSAPNADAVRIVSRSEIAQYVAAQGADPNEIQIDKYAGLPSNTPGALEALTADIEAAKQRRVSSSPERQVVQQFRTPAPPTNGRGAPVGNLANINDPDQLLNLVFQRKG